MKEKLFLQNPIKVNGTLRNELDYDISKITGEQFLEADIRAHSKAASLGKISLAVAETDASFQMYLGMMAIIAVDHEVDITDLERITGVDVMSLYRIGRNFTKGSAEEGEEEENPDSEASSLEGLTELTPELITQE